MSRESPYKIQLNARERGELKRLARRYTAPYHEVVRAKIVLLAEQGYSNCEISQRISLPRQIVSKWRKRYFKERISGLQNRARPGHQPIFSPADRHCGEEARL